MIRAKLESGDFDKRIIAADRGYQNRSYMVTPLKNCQTREQNLYNESQIHTRNCIKRFFFSLLELKLRFQG